MSPAYPSTVSQLRDIYDCASSYEVYRVLKLPKHWSLQVTQHNYLWMHRPILRVMLPIEGSMRDAVRSQGNCLQELVS